MKLLPLVLLFMAIQVSMTIYTLPNTIIPDVVNANAINSQTQSFVNPSITSQYYNASWYNQSSIYPMNNYTVTDTWASYIPGTSSALSSFGTLDFWVSFSQPYGGATKLIMAIIGLSVIIWLLGFFGLFRSDMSSLSPIFIGLLGVGFIPCLGLWSVVTKSTSSFACTAGSVCGFGSLIGLILTAPLYVAWIFACIEWWSARQTS